MYSLLLFSCLAVLSSVISSHQFQPNSHPSIQIINNKVELDDLFEDKDVAKHNFYFIGDKSRNSLSKTVSKQIKDVFNWVSLLANTNKVWLEVRDRNGSEEANESKQDKYESAHSSEEDHHSIIDVPKPINEPPQVIDVLPQPVDVVPKPIDVIPLPIDEVPVPVKVPQYVDDVTIPLDNVPLTVDDVVPVEDILKPVDKDPKSETEDLPEIDYEADVPLTGDNENFFTAEEIANLTYSIRNLTDSVQFLGKVILKFSVENWVKEPLFNRQPYFINRILKRRSSYD